MTRISNLEIQQIVPVLTKVKEKTSGCATLEEAAQSVVDTLYSEYSESIILARVFATIPYHKLPLRNQTFIFQLAAKYNISDLLGDETLAISLLGSRGVKPEWNDRRTSQEHIGVPLASEAFVDQIPMMSRLLREIGVDLTWINSNSPNLMVSAISRISGIFYVEDASTAVDQQNRKIVSAQDFVEEQQVKTVFGLAGGYANSSVFITLLVFSRETLVRSQAALFSSIITSLKANTMSQVTRSMFFKD